MNKIKLIFSVIIPLLFISGCSSSNSTTGFEFGKGKYRFTMSDSTGSKLAEGILNVVSYSNNKISGTYDITKKYKEFDGIEVMNGEFSGDINKTEKTVFINTNPKIADANVFWNMKFTKSGLSGTWIYSVFRGNATGGKVKITNY